MAQFNITLESELLHGLFSKDGRDDAFSKLLETIVCCIIKMDKVANKNTHFCKGNIPRIAKAIESKIKPRYPIR